MPRATLFSDRFLWGTATAAHQVEGNNTNNDWWAWEQEEGRIHEGDRSGKACDWWGGRWREDFDRARDSWQNAHRFSIEWSRIQPEPDAGTKRFWIAIAKCFGFTRTQYDPDCDASSLHHSALAGWNGRLENEEVVELLLPMPAERSKSNPMQIWVILTSQMF